LSLSLFTHPLLHTLFHSLTSLNINELHTFSFIALQSLFHCVSYNIHTTFKYPTFSFPHGLLFYSCSLTL
jgi:hypothetical protein